jgi:phosphatidylglycerol:prolipoprotein diacylglycerol transferase
MLPNLIQIGNFFLPTYGLLAVLGFMTALWMSSRLGRAAGLDPEAVFNLGIYSGLAALLGAKALLIALDFRYYLQSPSELLSMATLRAGGIFYGGLVAALVTAFLYMRRKKLPGLVTADAFAPGLALGHSIGRLGCFAAGCCWGVPTRLPWAVTFSSQIAQDRVGVPLGEPLHPTQLYESLAEAVVFLILYRRYRRPHRPGAIIGLYLALYSSARFFVEFVRYHDPTNAYFGPLVTEQWIALALVGLGIWLMARPAQIDARRHAST